MNAIRTKLIEQNREISQEVLNDWRVAGRTQKKGIAQQLSRFKIKRLAMIVHLALMDKDIKSASEIAEYIALERWKEG